VEVVLPSASRLAYVCRSALGGRPVPLVLADPKTHFELPLCAAVVLISIGAGFSADPRDQAHGAQRGRLHAWPAARHPEGGATQSE
jgi:hypothetical protein